MSFSPVPTVRKTYDLSTIDVQSLLEMIIIRRPARYEGDEELIERFLDPIDGMQEDEHGNRILKIGDAPVMWSCHTDTVHSSKSFDKYQRIRFDKGIISLAKDEKSNCLGADCTAGIWIMLEMIKGGVEGLYIFHRDEEVGGYGSSYVAKHHLDLIKDIKYAIAFDRKGNSSIITHQAMERCASDAFAESLSKLLPVGYLKDDGGTFTDTANYTSIIPECTNISVGYDDAHSSKESLNVYDLLRLREAMLKFDHTQLVCERDPSITEYSEDFMRYSTRTSAYRSSYGLDDWEDRDAIWRKPEGKKVFDLTPHIEGIDYEDYDPDEYPNMACRTLKEFITTYPDVAADYLEQQGYAVEDFYEQFPWLA